MWLVRAEGRAAWRRLSAAVAASRPPGTRGPRRRPGAGRRRAADRARASSPTSLGLLLLAPPTRALARTGIVRNFQSRLVVRATRFSGAPPSAYDVDSTASDIDPPRAASMTVTAEPALRIVAFGDPRGPRLGRGASTPASARSCSGSRRRRARHRRRGRRAAGLRGRRDRGAARAPRRRMEPGVGLVLTDGDPGRRRGGQRARRRTGRRADDAAGAGPAPTGDELLPRARHGRRRRRPTSRSTVPAPGARRGRCSPSLDSISLRGVWGWFEDEQALALLALRPRGRDGPGGRPAGRRRCSTPRGRSPSRSRGCRPPTRRRPPLPRQPRAVDRRGRGAVSAPRRRRGARPRRRRRAPPG